VDITDLKFAKNLVAMEGKIIAQKNRYFDDGEVAALVNEYRFNPFKEFGKSSGEIPDIDELIKRTPTSAINRWNFQLGLKKPSMEKAMYKAARQKGRQIPNSNAAFNLAGYIGVPLGAAFKETNPWGVFAANLGITLIQPYLTAPAQQMIVAALDVYQQKKAPSIQLDKTAINSKNALRQWGSKAIRESANVARETQAVIDCHRTIAEAHGIAWPGDEHVTLDLLNHVKATADGDQKRLIRLRVRTYAKSFTAMAQAVVEIQSGKGQHRRQSRSTRAQIPARTGRAASAFAKTGVRHYYTNQLKESGKSLNDLLKDSHWYTPAQKAGMVGAGVAGAFQFASRITAGWDEVRAIKEENMLNFHLADIFTAEGHAAWRRGEDILPEHIDGKKFRALLAFPEEKICSRVEKIIGLWKKAEEAKQARHPVGSDLEAAGNRKIADYEDDLRILKSGKVSEFLKEEKNGSEAKKLLLKAMGNWAMGYVLTEGWENLTWQKLSEQVSQRNGVQLEMIAGGNIAAITAGPLITAILGGTDNISLGGQYGIATASTTFGFISATTQSMVVDQKEYRRSNNEDVGFFKQTGLSIGAPVVDGIDRKRGKQGLKAAKKLIEPRHGLLAPLRNEAFNDPEFE
ncbi:MAG: hypothetical protein ABW032_02680, partial [Burkholderiaceae bacterium]